MHIGIHIRNIRKQKGLTQKELAQKVSLDFTQLNRIETGKSEPSLKNLKLIAECLEVSIDQIVYGKENIEEPVSTQNKPLWEKIRLIERLNEEDKNALIKIIDIALTKEKFTNFFKEQVVLS